MTVAPDKRQGFSTGTCAAAAAKAAAAALLGSAGDFVDVELPGGERVVLPVAASQCVSPGRAWAAVMKDAGDDPDVTDGMTVRVDLELLDARRVEARDEATGSPGPPQVEFVAGEGVGTVTRAGLQIGVGEPAINPVPRAMIVRALGQTLGERRCRVTVAIPGGQAVAARTFNPRLGIAGGLSILGTSGRVIPRSEEAWLRALIPQIDVALAAGLRTIFLAPGRFGERAAVEALGAPATAIVRCSNFVGALLDACAERGVERIVLIGHVGKVVKVAAGIFDTHSRHGDARLETVAALAGAAGAPAGVVARLLDLPTVEAALPLLAEAGLGDVWDDVAERAAARSSRRAALAARAASQAPPVVDCALVGYEEVVVGRSGRLRASVPDHPRPVIDVVGVGPSSEDWMVPAAWRAIRGAQVVVGGARQLAQFAPAQAERITIGTDLDGLEDAIRNRMDRRIVVLASGDPCCYGILSTLRRRFPDVELRVVAGVSSFQLALARLNLSWEDVRFASAHGRELGEILFDAKIEPRVLALTDARHSPRAIAASLAEAGIAGRMTVFERLGYPDERMTRGRLVDIAAGDFDALCVVLFEADDGESVSH